MQGSLLNMHFMPHLKQPCAGGFGRGSLQDGAEHGWLHGPWAANVGRGCGRHASQRLAPGAQTFRLCSFPLFPVVFSLNSPTSTSDSLVRDPKSKSIKDANFKVEVYSSTFFYPVRRGVQVCRWKSIVEYLKMWVGPLSRQRTARNRWGLPLVHNKNIHEDLLSTHASLHIPALHLIWPGVHATQNEEVYCPGAVGL